MKYLKTYENLNEPQVDDYVICKSDYFDELKKYLPYNIGKINGFDISGSGEKLYEIVYEDIPFEFHDCFFTVDDSDLYDIGQIDLHRHEILHFSEDYEDLEPYIETDKYNL